MLVLARKVGEQIVIGDRIVVTFMGFSRSRHAIKIGVEAPRNIAVLREELVGARRAGGVSPLSLLTEEEKRPP